MIGSLFMMLQAVTSVGQTGGITAVSIATVNMAPGVAFVTGYDPNCLVARGWYVRRDDLLLSTKTFRALSDGGKRSALRQCEFRRVIDGEGS